MTVPVDVRFPVCDVCNRKVQTIEWWDDYARDVRYFKVTCHGETETAFLPRYMIEDSLSITMGRAFVKERLSAEKRTPQQIEGQTSAQAKEHGIDQDAA